MAGLSLHLAAKTWDGTRVIDVAAGFVSANGHYFEVCFCEACIYSMYAPFLLSRL